MSVLAVRNVLPVVTSVVAALFLATGVPQGLVPEAAAAGLEASASADVQACMGQGRADDECLDEADGKALVERAEWLARDDRDAGRAGR